MGFFRHNQNVTSVLGSERMSPRQVQKLAKISATMQKLSHKRSRHQRKLLAKQEKHLLDIERKAVKSQRKFELKRAEAKYKELKAGRFSAGTLLRYAGAARIAAPILLPLAYRGIIRAREYFFDRRAAALGITPERLSSFAGAGAPLKARIDALRREICDAAISEEVRNDLLKRLQDLNISIDNAESMADEQRRSAHHAIDSDLHALAQKMRTAQRNKH